MIEEAEYYMQLILIQLLAGKKSRIHISQSVTVCHFMQQVELQELCVVYAGKR